MERAEEGQEQGRVSSFTAGISLSSLNLERPCLKGTCTKSNCRPRSAAKITLRLRGGWLVDSWSIYLIMHIARDNNNTRSSSCRGRSRGREREGDCEQETKIYNFARHSAYKMSQQTTAGAEQEVVGGAVAAVGGCCRGVGCADIYGAGSGVAQRGQAVKRQPPLPTPTPTTIRKQTNPPATTLAEMYTTSLSLCLLRATCASDVAMICIEVWHKKQNSSGQAEEAGGAARKEEQPVGTWSRELCAACFYDTYATLWFGPRRPLPTHIHIHI